MLCIEPEIFHRAVPTSELTDLIEGHAKSTKISPNDMTWKTRATIQNIQNDLIGYNVWGLNFDHRSRRRKVSHCAIQALAAKRDLSSFDNPLPSCRTFIHHSKRIRCPFPNSSK